VKTFDDFPEAVMRAFPDRRDYTNVGKPEAGTMGERAIDSPPYTESKKIIRAKPISAQEVTKMVMANEDVMPNLWFKQHDTRPFVMWLIEVEP
jgi:hypothetical protein